MPIDQTMDTSTSFLEKVEAITQTSYPYLFFVQCMYYISMNRKIGKLQPSYFTDLFASFFASTVVPVIFFNDIPGLSFTFFNI